MKKKILHLSQLVTPSGSKTSEGVRPNLFTRRGRNSEQNCKCHAVETEKSKKSKKVLIFLIQCGRKQNVRSERGDNTPFRRYQSGGITSSGSFEQAWSFLHRHCLVAGGVTLRAKLSPRKARRSPLDVCIGHDIRDVGTLTNGSVQQFGTRLDLNDNL